MRESSQEFVFQTIGLLGISARNTFAHQKLRKLFLRSLSLLKLADLSADGGYHIEQIGIR